MQKVLSLAKIQNLRGDFREHNKPALESKTFFLLWLLVNKWRYYNSIHYLTPIPAQLPPNSNWKWLNTALGDTRWGTRNPTNAFEKVGSEENPQPHSKRIWAGRRKECPAIFLLLPFPYGFPRELQGQGESSLANGWLPQLMTEDTACDRSSCARPFSYTAHVFVHIVGFITWQIYRFAPSWGRKRCLFAQRKQ